MIEVEITPMIDVVFLLIIFFMTTAQFVQMTRAEVDLPIEKGEQEDVADEAGLLINVLVNGEYVVNAETLQLPDVMMVVRRSIAEKTEDPTGFKLMIRADRNADSAALNDLVEALQDEGVGLARLATEVPR